LMEKGGGGTEFIGKMRRKGTEDMYVKEDA